MGIKNCTLKNKQKNNISLEKNNELIDHKIAYKKIDDTCLLYTSDAADD